MRPALLILLVAASASGCGTVCNLAGGVLHPDSEPRVYGGVQRDVETIEWMTSHRWDVTEGPQGKAAALAFAAFIGVALADPLLSLVADTLTLPITIPLQNRRIASQRGADGSIKVELAIPTDPRATLGEPCPIDPTGEGQAAKSPIQEPTS